MVPFVVRPAGEDDVTHTTRQSRREFLRTVGVAGGASLAMGTASARQEAVRIRAVHAAPGAPATDVLVNDQPILEGASFPTVGGYFEGRADAFTVSAVPSGGGEPIARLTFSPDPGTTHTVAVAGTGDDVHVEWFVDRVERPESGAAGWRAVNLLPDSPGLDVAVEGRQTFFRGIEFGEQSRYRPIRPGTGAVVVRRGGTDRRLRAFEGAAFEADTVYSAFLVGSLSGSPAASLLLAEDASFSG